MADVFLSYAREDLLFVRRLTAALQARDRDVWVDLDDIIPSARWMEEIRSGITGADAVVFVLTPDSVVSEVCRVELDYAAEVSKRLVPIVAGETSAGSVPLALAELNWLSFLDDIDFEVAVDRLIEVLDTDIDRVHLHTRLLTQAREWETRARDRGLLLRGGELKEAETWLADQTGRKPAASPAQAQLILASRRAATRRLGLFGSVGMFLVVVMAVLTTFALIQRQTAVHQSQIAISRALTANSRSLVTNDSEASMLLAVEAFHYLPTLETRSALLSTQAQYFAGQFTDRTGSVLKVAFSPDGHILATSGGPGGGGARLWDVASHQPITTLTGHTGSVFGVAFSPDGRTLATTGDDRTARLWDVSDPGHPSPLGTLTGHSDIVYSVAFSGDGHTLATVSLDRTARLWDVSDLRRPGPLATLTGHTDNVVSVAFSPDGRTLATGGGDGTARLWDVARRTQIATLTGHNNPVGGVAFSPDGRTLATGGDDNTARLWDRISHQLIATLTGHNNPVASVAFSMDGRTLATASTDGTARLWDVASHQEIVILTGHTNSVYGAAFSPAGHTLATASTDGTVKLWDINGHALLS
ncbi:MAG: toll/interleukin-1 receptor domain-containing protein, partial [Pseudonocardiaceae bacterium]